MTDQIKKPAPREHSGPVKVQNNEGDGMDDSNSTTRSDQWAINDTIIPFARVPVWIARAGTNLSSNARSLYMVLMSYADNTTLTAFPAQSTLAEDMGTSVATVKRAITELENFGAIKVERRRNQRSGNYYANHYTLIIESPWLTGELRRGITGEPITIPTKLTIPTNYFMSDSDESDPKCFMSDSDESDARKIFTTDSQTTDTKMTPAQADPIGPAFYESQDRLILINNVQEMALYRKIGHDLQKQNADSTQLGHAADQYESSQIQFSNNLRVAFPDVDEDTAEGMMFDYGWQPPLKASTDRYTAARWFNKFINSLSQLNFERLIWRGLEASEQAQQKETA